MRILLVGQDGNLANSLRESFWAHKAEVNCCHPAQSITSIARDQPDIVCIDTESSFQLPAFFLQLQKLYVAPGSGGYYPIVIGIIPRQIEIKHSRIYLDLGFDLVFQKPVDNELFFAQINALDRRVGIGKETLISPHLLLNTKTHDCYFKNTSGTLLVHFRVTPIQFALLKILIQSPRGIWNRTELTRRLTSDVKDTLRATVETRTIDKSIHKIRKVVADRLDTLADRQQWQLVTGYKYPFIQTEDCAGYYFFDALSFPGDANWGIQPPGSNLYETPCSTCKHRVTDCAACSNNRNLSPLVAETLFSRAQPQTKRS